MDEINVRQLAGKIKQSAREGEGDNKFDSINNLIHNTRDYSGQGNISIRGFPNKKGIYF